MPTFSKINYINPKELIPYENNSKTHPNDQIETLVKLIDNYGFPEGKAVLCDQEKVIIHGHGRTLAAIACGLERIPYQVVTDLSDADIMAWRISDNAVSESDWDYQKLNLDIKTLEKVDYNIELLAMNDTHLEAMGFEIREENIENGQTKGNEQKDKTQKICPNCGHTF